MEPIAFSLVNGKIFIAGYPEAEKIIKLDDEKARRFSDLGLHNNDLDLSLECLNRIDIAKAKEDFLMDLYWECAIIHFMKCFGVNESRFKLNFEKIYGNSDGAKISFNYFKNLRNKHIIHDENSYSQSLVGAIINNEKCITKVAKIINNTVTANTLELSNYHNLNLLVIKARKWVVEQFDVIANQILIELEKLNHAELIKREELILRVPEISEIGESRRKI